MCVCVCVTLGKMGWGLFFCFVLVGWLADWLVGLGLFCLFCFVWGIWWWWWVLWGAGLLFVWILGGGWFGCSFWFGLVGSLVGCSFIGLLICFDCNTSFQNHFDSGAGIFQGH